MSCLINIRDAHPFYRKAVNEICDYIGVQRIPIYAADIGNACATNWDQWKTPVITYQPHYLDNMSDESAYFVVAHEIAHHYLGHLGRKSQLSSWKMEFEADTFATAILYDKGFNKQEALFAVRSSICCEGISKTHPSTDLRMGNFHIAWGRISADLIPYARSWGNHNLASGCR